MYFPSKKSWFYMFSPASSSACHSHQLPCLHAEVYYPLSSAVTITCVAILPNDISVMNQSKINTILIIIKSTHTHTKTKASSYQWLFIAHSYKWEAGSTCLRSCLPLLLFSLKFSHIQLLLFWRLVLAAKAK